MVVFMTQRSSELSDYKRQNRENFQSKYFDSFEPNACCSMDKFVESVRDKQCSCNMRYADYHNQNFIRKSPENAALKVSNYIY